MTLHTYNPKLPAFYAFTDIAQTNFLKVKVIRARTKVKSRSHYDIAHLQCLSNVPTNYQLPTHYGFGDIARTKHLRSRLLQQKK